MNTKHEAYAAGSCLAVGFGWLGEKGHSGAAVSGLAALVTSAIMFGVFNFTHQKGRQR